MHRQARYANRVYGHARRDTQGRLWLQYWLFYYYNDFQLLGPLLSGGKHEGDWELVQLRLNAAEQPEQVVYSQHTHSESKAWNDVKKAGNDAARLRRARLARELLRPRARTGRACGGTTPTARARRSRPTLDVVEDATPWMLWPGRWGDTKATSSPLDSRARTARAAARTGSTRRR